MNTPLPGYPGGANGLVLALSQTPCVGPTVRPRREPLRPRRPCLTSCCARRLQNTNCCNNNNICANWAGAHRAARRAPRGAAQGSCPAVWLSRARFLCAGAHLVSAGCVQFGVLEIEAAFNMPINGGGFFFL